MLEKHTTREGKTMLIAEMDDSHLRNMINLLLDKLEQLKTIAENGEGENDLENKLYDRPNMISAEEAVRLWRIGVKGLYPYLAEAMLREAIYDSIHERMTEVFGRHMPIEKAPRILERRALPMGSLTVDDEEWFDDELNF